MKIQPLLNQFNNSFGTFKSASRRAKSTLLICGLILAVSVSSCKKESNPTSVALGTVFTLKNIRVTDLTMKVDGVSVTPSNPFTVDSIYKIEDKGNVYYCHSSNKLVYMLPISDMKF